MVPSQSKQNWWVRHALRSKGWGTSQRGGGMEAESLEEAEERRQKLGSAWRVSRVLGWLLCG